jgi:hypothetical protein
MVPGVKGPRVRVCFATSLAPETLEPLALRFAGQTANRLFKNSANRLTLQRPIPSIGLLQSGHFPSLIR